ncbi:MAG: AAA family ATPase [bacterium]
MIEKFNLIRNTGKFFNFTGSNDDFFLSEKALIIANNAYGKSTITTILKSLANNNYDILLAKKTVHKRTPQKISLKIDGNSFNFENGTWDKELPDDINIMIFDTQFIQNNILSQEITLEHKTTIHNLLIGNEAVEISKKLEELNKLIRVQKTELSKLVEDFTNIGFSKDINEYINIPAKYQLQKIIDVKEKLVQQLNAKVEENKIKSIPKLQFLTFNEFDFSSISCLITHTTNKVFDKAKKKVFDHIRTHCKGNPKAYSFLKTGIELLDKDCPFCGQDITPVEELINAYKEFILNSNKNIKEVFNSTIIQFQEWNVEKEFNSLEHIIQNNNDHIKQWKEYVSFNINLPVEEKFPTILENIVKTNKVIIEELQNKNNNLDHHFDINLLDEIFVYLNNIESFIGNYNKIIFDINDIISNYILSIPEEDLSKLRQNLNQLKIMEKRFESDRLEWCNKYVKSIENIDTLTKKQIEFEKQLNVFYQQVLKDYKDRINELLYEFGTNYQITPFHPKHDKRRNESYIDFSFNLFDVEIPINPKTENCACFNNTLSEGDKSALAFAFFMSYLEKKDNLDKCIVVFDDPLSSLDQNRRLGTVDCINKFIIEKRPNQVIILTHKKDFVHLIDRRIRGFKYFSIKSDNTNGSSLLVFDVREDMKHEYHKLIDKFNDFCNVDNGITTKEIQQDIRNVFEIGLKFKYYTELSKETFGDIIIELSETGFINEIKSDLWSLCNLSNSPHHGEIIFNPLTELSREEMIPKVNKTLEVLLKI